MPDMFPATAAGVSTAQKIAALEREIKYRRHVYRGRVSNGTMSQAKADHEILVMESILADYRAKL